MVSVGQLPNLGHLSVHCRIRAMHADQSFVDSYSGNLLGSEACQRLRCCCIRYVDRIESAESYLTSKSAYWAAVDFTLAILPITFIWKLQLTLRKRIALCCILGLGVL